jgi:hypothetical protein
MWKMDREDFSNIISVFKHRSPFQPFTVAMVNGDRLEVDHPDALALRDGMALFAAPGNVPVIFDNEGVSQVIGDLSGRGAET